MKIGIAKRFLISSMLLAIDVDAFSISSPISKMNMMSTQTNRVERVTRLHQTPEGSAEEDSEIDRLRSMAAKLRAEAAALEVRDRFLDSSERKNDS